MAGAAAGDGRLPTRDIAALLLIATIWGANAIPTKYALMHLPPLMAACLRFAITALALAAFWRPAPGALKPLAFVGAVTAVHFAVQSVGLWLAEDVGPMVIAMQLWIPATAIFASIFLGERMGPARIVGVAVSMLGVVVLAAEPTLARQWGAFALVALASVIYGAASVIVRRSPPVHPLAYQAWVALIGLALLTPASLASEPAPGPTIAAAGWGPIAAIAFAAIGSSIFANALMFSLVQKYEVSRTTPFMFLSPVIGLALGAALMGDAVTVQTLIGSAIVLAGVAATALADRIRVTRLRR
ncbi:MAG: DMT family transporter [Hyphomonadaceae bacterium]|nr:DMT family transporter [Hyphomonadaceae bacterium]